MKRHLKWILPLLAIALLAPFTPLLDLTIARFFYEPQGHFERTSLTNVLFRYGDWIGLGLGIAATAIFPASYFLSPLAKWRRGAMALGITMAVGSGLLINATFKDHWGRPRPRQITLFGGTAPYRPFYKPHFAKENEAHKSFPSGHVSMGAYYLSLYLVLRRYQKKFLARCTLACSFLIGALLAYARFAEGGHFFSDALFSFLIMWLTALFADYLSFETPLLPLLEKTFLRKTFTEN